MSRIIFLNISKWSILKGILFFFWPLIILSFIYILSFVHGGFYGDKKSIHTTNGNVSLKQNEKITPRDLFHRRHYTVYQEEIVESPTNALVKSAIIVHGKWKQQDIICLFDELSARYAKRSDFYKFAHPTDISITIFGSGNSNGKQSASYLACLYMHEGNEPRIQWNPEAFTDEEMQSLQIRQECIAALHQSLEAISNTQPEVEILPSYENPHAFQISIIDHGFHGNPRQYVALVARCAKEFLSGVSQPCEGIFVALYWGNYFISPDVCLSLPDVPSFYGSAYSFDEIVWGNVGKNEYF